MDRDLQILESLHTAVRRVEQSLPPPPDIWEDHVGHLGADEVPTEEARRWR